MTAQEAAKMRRRVDEILEWVERAKSEISRLTAERDELQCQKIQHRKNWEELQRENTCLTAELAAAREDVARCDWLDKWNTGLGLRLLGYLSRVGSDAAARMTFREAIDAARKGEG